MLLKEHLRDINGRNEKTRTYKTTSLPTEYHNRTFFISRTHIRELHGVLETRWSARSRFIERGRPDNSHSCSLVEYGRDYNLQLTLGRFCYLPILLLIFQSIHVNITSATEVCMYPSSITYYILTVFCVPYGYAWFLSDMEISDHMEKNF